MSKVRTSSDILNDLIVAGKAANDARSWVARSPESDILTAVTSEFARQYATLDYVRYLTRLGGYVDLQNDTGLRDVLMTIWDVTEDELDEIFKTDLDNYAEIWNTTRTPGVKARGPMKMIFANDNPVSIAQGTMFYSSARRKEYLTTETILNQAPILENGQYVLRVMIEHRTIGADGNIAVGSSMIPEVSVSGLIQSTIPVTIENGSDEETNQEFVNRIRILRRSRGVGSRAFLTNLMLSDSRVYDIWLNAKGDIDFERPLGIDVWVYAQETATSTSDTVKSSYGYVFETQPLIYENALITNGGLNLSKDTGYYSKSVDAVDAVNGGAIASTVQYYYDKTIRDLQLAVEDMDNWLLGGRRLVLVKKAYPIKFNIGMKVYYDFGATVADVKQNIQNNLLYFFVGGTTSYGEKFDRKGLGVTVDKSDLTYVVRATDGVDRVDLENFNVTMYLTDVGITLTPVTEVYSLANNNWGTLGTITWL